MSKNVHIPIVKIKKNDGKDIIKKYCRYHMLEEFGDFWEIKGDIRCITTNGTLRHNGNAIMRAGIALQARNRYMKDGINLEAILGKKISRHGNHVHFLTDDLISFPTKHHWRERSDIKLIKRSAVELVHTTNHAPSDKRILLTRPGCHNGRLDWNYVMPIIADILDDRFIIVEKDKNIKR